MTLTLVIGNKDLSSWSLRADLMLKLAGATYQYLLIPLNQGELTRIRLAEHSPSGKVPVLKTEDCVVWDTLAIAEYLAERFPQAGLWPEARLARIHARTLCAEMHSGFAALRTHLLMNLKRNAPAGALPDSVLCDLQRIRAIWNECRQRYGHQGPFLFGAPSIADAFFAPVATRLRNYQIRLDGVCDQYVETLHQWPLLRQWYDEAVGPLTARGAA